MHLTAHITKTSELIRMTLCRLECHFFLNTALSSLFTNVSADFNDVLF